MKKENDYKKENTMEFLNELYKIGLRLSYTDAFKQYFLNGGQARKTVSFIGPLDGHIKLAVIDQGKVNNFEESIKNAVVVFTTDCSHFGKIEDVVATLETKMSDFHKTIYYKTLDQYYDVDDNLNYKPVDKLKAIYKVLPGCITKLVDEVVDKLYKEYLALSICNDSVSTRLKKAYELAQKQEKKVDDEDTDDDDNDDDDGLIDIDFLKHFAKLYFLSKIL